MKRWIGLAVRLYPEGWRQRYGAEFGALLEEVNPGWREFLDVLRGALIMRTTSAGMYLKLAAAVAVAGAVVALLASYGVPRRYVSTAVLRFEPAQYEDVVDRILRIQQETLSRGSLSEIIQRPSLNLYREERQRLPLEDVIEQMRGDIQVRWQERPPNAWSISFSYRDKEKAQAVAQALADRMMRSNTSVDHMRVWAWREIGPRFGAPPVGSKLALIDPASLPVRPTGPNRFLMMAWGLAAGLVLGLLAALFLRRPKWTLQMAGFGAAGCVLALAGSYLVSDEYTSSATMRITPPLVPDRLLGDMAPAPAGERLSRLEEEVLGRNSLAILIQKPWLNLYAAERARLPLEDVVERMRKQIQIRALNMPGRPAAVAFQISFTYPDRNKAQAVVRGLVTGFTEANVIVERARWEGGRKDDAVARIFELKLGGNLEILDPASMPNTPIWPPRATVMTAGLGIGLLLGAIAGWRRRWRGLSSNLHLAPR